MCDVRIFVKHSTKQTKNHIYCTFYQTWVVLPALVPPSAPPSSLGTAFKFNTILFGQTFYCENLIQTIPSCVESCFFIAFHFEWICIGAHAHICMWFSWWKHLGNLNKMTNALHLFAWKMAVLFLLNLDDFQEKPSNEDVSLCAYNLKYAKLILCMAQKYSLVEEYI